MQTQIYKKEKYEMILNFKTVNFPSIFEIRLFSSHFFSGVPGRKGEGMRQNGDMVNNTHQSNQTRNSKPQVTKAVRGVHR